MDPIGFISFSSKPFGNWLPKGFCFFVTSAAFCSVGAGIHLSRLHVFSLIAFNRFGNLLPNLFPRSSDLGHSANLRNVSQSEAAVDIRDKAIAMQEYARQAKDTKLIGYATEIRLRAEKRAGELIAGMKKNEGTRSQKIPSGPGRGKKSKTGGSDLQPPVSDNPTLKSLGLTKTQSSKWQALAKLSEDKLRGENCS